MAEEKEPTKEEKKEKIETETLELMTPPAEKPDLEEGIEKIITIDDIKETLESISTTPTHKPKRFFEQIVFYKSGSIYRIYFHIKDAWKKIFDSIEYADLTDSGDTILHIHDSRYYTETEVDTSVRNILDYILDATSIRALNTVYQNTSGRTRLVIATVQLRRDCNSGTYGRAYARIGSSNPPTTDISEAQVYATSTCANTIDVTTLISIPIFIVIPDNYYYAIYSDTNVGTAGLVRWIEIQKT